MARKSWGFLVSSVIGTVTGGIIGARAANADNLSPSVFIGAMVAFAVNEASAIAAAYFWAKQDNKRPCWNSYTLGAAMTMLTASAGFTASMLAYSKCDGSFTCLDASAAWAAALGIHTAHGLALLCSESGKNNNYHPV